MSPFGRNRGYDYTVRGTEQYRYDQGFGRAGQSGLWGREPGFDRGTPRYGSDYRTYGGYDQNYKSRWQTDYGDPYGDRLNQTPMRVIRGEYEGRGDRFGSRYDAGYGRDYSTSPAGYEPYGRTGRGPEGSWGGREGQQSWSNRGREGTWGGRTGQERWGGQGYRDINRGYDRGWF